MTYTIANIKKMLKQFANDAVSREDFNDMVRSAGEFIGKGAFRIVVQFGRFVVKVRVLPQDSSFTEDRVDRANRDEIAVYQKVAKKSLSLAAFILKPTYVRLPFGHDAIIMPVVDSLHEGDEDFGGEWDDVFDDVKKKFFSRIMKKQLEFIENTFNDSHCCNIGWDRAQQRVWLIDANMCCKTYDEDTSKAAERILKRLEMTKAA